MTGDECHLAVVRRGRRVRHVCDGVVRPAAWHAYGLREEQREFIRQLTGTRPLVLASLGAPYELQNFPDAAVRICTYSDVPVSQIALADVLAGPT